MRSATLLALLLLSAPATGSIIKREIVECPVCGTEVDVELALSSFSFDDRDLDLCHHYPHNDPKSLAIWTCTRCLYSRDSSEFEEAIAPGMARRIREELTTSVFVPLHTAQDRIPGWQKYALAGQILEWECADPLVLAEHYLFAAWTVRCESGRLFDYLWRNERLRARRRAVEKQERDRAEKEHPRAGTAPFGPCRRDIASAERILEETAKGSLDSTDTALRRLLAVERYRTRGENLPAREVARKLAGDDSAPTPVRAVAWLVVRSIDRERRFQEQWLRYFSIAMKSDSPACGRRARLAFIAGETCRRLGRSEEAHEWFHRSLIETLALIARIADWRLWWGTQGGR